MTEEEKKVRIQQLWGKLRIAAHIKGGLDYIERYENGKDIQNLGLDSDASLELSDSQELEEQLVYTVEDEHANLDWYIVNPESTFSKVQNLQVQIFTWFTLLLTPFLLVFGQEEQIKNTLIWLEWIVDISWTIEICLNFITADGGNTTFKEIAKNYLRLWFWIDSIATFPCMILK